MNWNINPVTGDYVMNGGSPEITKSLTIPAYIRLKVQRTRWLYAPDNQYGSDFWTVLKKKTNGDATAIENIAGRALQALLDDGRASQITIETQKQTRDAVGMQINITDAEGETERLQFTPVGG